jgi:hypothetical protein
MLGIAKVMWVSRLGFRRDFVGYEKLIDYVERANLWQRPGDLLEIGAFMGGGTKKLADAARPYGKKVIVVDAFDPDLDPTKNDKGVPMSWVYNAILGRRNLRYIFDETTRACNNISVYARDSRSFSLPSDQLLIFSFIDGHHSSEAVTHDFQLAWRRTISGGIVAVHDYGGDLSPVTIAIDRLREELHGNEVGSVQVDRRKTLIVISKA